MSLDNYYIRRNSELREISAEQNSIKMKTISTIQSDVKDNINDSIFRLTNKSNLKTKNTITAESFFKQKGY